ncbi:MAG: zinc-binding dehydrogenase [Chloroflexi bacterium]|nr:zinc-binding dehydrogenase [Chloroflexota bacterium]
MFAVKLIASRKFELIDKPAPQIETAPPNSILIKTRRATICGSDVAYYLGVTPAFAPDSFPAHECVGDVIASNSPHFKIGEAVMAQPHLFQGLAEFYLARDSHAVHIPNDGDWKKWIMCQPLGTVLWAMRKIGALFHQQVVVLGQGAIGLFATQMCANLGARTIVAIDPLQNRLDISARVGATHTIAQTDESLFDSVAKIVGDAGADLVIEAVGHQTETINSAIRLVKHSGAILALGVDDQDVYPIRYHDLFRKNARLIPSVIATDMPKDFALALQYIQNGRVSVDGFATHEFPFARVQDAFELFREKREGVLKVMINYDQ